MIGKNLAHYEILEPLGSGGMGDVYRAHDKTLNRDVAIKVLHEDVADDPDRLARLKREAHLLAALNHPNVATIHGFEESNGTRFLVMELVKGESLEQRLTAGRLPVEEALEICRQIAEALEAAHDQGIIHRDLKPANVLITPDGRAKVLDFGLAKTAERATSDTDLSHSPTITIAGTEAGVILGTAPYMSPEQVRGRPLDKRTDIWAFGCVLYEALSGSRAFNRETVADTLAAILEVDPPWDALPAAAPVPIRSLLRRCLRKDSRRRLHDIADARIEIEESLDEPQSVVSGDDVAGPIVSHRLLLPAAIAAVVVVGSLLVWYLTRQPPIVETPGIVSRFTIPAAPAARLGVTDELDAGRVRLSRTAVAISPDGSHLVYVGGDADGSRLYLRPIGQYDATAIEGTEGAIGPFFSPQGDQVGFWAGGEIRKISLDGGLAVRICDFPFPPFGASWGLGGNIVLGQEVGPLLQVSDSGGGSISPFTALDDERFEISHRLPHYLPDGNAVLFTVRHPTKSAWQTAEVWVASRAGEEIQRALVYENGTDARYVSSGHVVFVRLGGLMAAPFDRERLEVVGALAGVEEGVYHAIGRGNTFSDTGAAQFGVSENGILVHVRGPNLIERRHSAFWVSRDGDETPMGAPTDGLVGLRISPTGARVVVSRTRDDVKDVWVLDPANPTPMTQLTLSLQTETYPLWIDDEQIVFRSTGAEAQRGIYRMKAEPGSVPGLLLAGTGTPASTLDDGTVAYLPEDDGHNPRDIWVLPPDGEPRPLLDGPEADEVWPAFSPDGRWLAYGSTISGLWQVWVQPYPGPGEARMISTDGGAAPAWSQDGSEIFYRSLGDEDGIPWMMAAEFDPQLGSRVGQPQKLFVHRYNIGRPVRNYDVARDGRFLMSRTESVPRQDATEINIVLNWFEELKRLVPIGQ